MKERWVRGIERERAQTVIVFGSNLEKKRDTIFVVS